MLTIHNKMTAIQYIFRCFFVSFQSAREPIESKLLFFVVCKCSESTSKYVAFFKFNSFIDGNSVVSNIIC